VAGEGAALAAVARVGDLDLVLGVGGEQRRGAGSFCSDLDARIRRSAEQTLDAREAGPATGRQTTTSGVYFFRMQDGRHAQHRGGPDMLSFLVQPSAPGTAAPTTSRRARGTGLSGSPGDPGSTDRPATHPLP
jgi:hypothetical protein